MKRRPFALLEVLLTIALIGLVGIPLISLPWYIGRKELEMVCETEVERLSETLFATISQHLTSWKTWEELPTQKREARWEPLAPLSLSLPGSSFAPCPVRYKVWRNKGKGNAIGIATYAIEYRLPSRKKIERTYKLLVENKKERVTSL